MPILFVPLRRVSLIGNGIWLRPKSYRFDSCTRYFGLMVLMAAYRSVKARVLVRSQLNPQAPVEEWHTHLAQTLGLLVQIQAGVWPYRGMAHSSALKVEALGSTPSRATVLLAQRQYVIL